jgi:predicted acylesterase/phospholipase RssA/thioredoxin reductase
VTTEDGRRFEYGKLLIATGASPVRFDLPGANLPGLHYLRTFEEALAIRGAASRGGHAVVIGASFIGMEVSAALRQRGLRVTVLVPRDGIFPVLEAPRLSEFFARLCAAHGVELIEDEVAGFDGDTRLMAVRLKGGSRIVCDFAVAGIDVVPDVGFLEDSGLRVDGGVLVDQGLQASDPHVFAAGDVANFIDPVFRVRHRIEHWDNAVKQGRLAARNMLGHRLQYDEVPTFFCEVFGVNFQVIGRPAGTTQRICIGSPEKGSWGLAYLDNHIPRALFTTGRPARETRSIQSLIRYRTHVGHLERRFAEPDFTLAGVPSQTALILQGGGALGAFECGVVTAMARRGIRPDVIAGVSIGAINGAILASHPRRGVQAMRAFWEELSQATPDLPDEPLRRLLSSAIALVFGVPNFFRPRWWTWGTGMFSTTPWTWFYDTSPARDLLRRHVDFDALRSSPVRLLVSATDVESAELRVFDSHIDDIGQDHILASASLSPGFPWTTITGMAASSAIRRWTSWSSTAGRPASGFSSSTSFPAGCCCRPTSPRWSPGGRRSPMRSASAAPGPSGPWWVNSASWFRRSSIMSRPTSRTGCGSVPVASSSWATTPSWTSPASSVNRPRASRSLATTIFRGARSCRTSAMVSSRPSVCWLARRQA